MRPARHLPVVRLAASLLAAVALGAAAEPPPADRAPAPAVPSPGSGVRLTAARNGAEVLLSWEIPPMEEIRLIELIRNTKSDTKGRGRVASVHAHPGHYADRLPDATATYWYWIKITLVNGRITIAGPVATPASEVWSTE